MSGFRSRGNSLSDDVTSGETERHSLLDFNARPHYDNNNYGHATSPSCEPDRKVEQDCKSRPSRPSRSRQGTNLDQEHLPDFSDAFNPDLAENGLGRRPTTLPKDGPDKMTLGRLERSRSARVRSPAEDHGDSPSSAAATPASSPGESPPPARGVPAPSPGGIWASTPRQKVIFACLAVSNMINFMPQSVIAPFFPKEAQLKGMSTTMIGWIFGAFALVQVFACPLFGIIIPSTGPKFLLLTGSFVAGVSSILFGLLDLVSVEKGPGLFIAMCFLTRSFLALGCAAISTANLSLGAVTFPDNPSTVLGIIETACGVGLMTGPAIGGLLYEAGGYRLPFIVMGGVILVSMPLYICILPNHPVKNTNTSKRTMLQVLKIPKVWVVGLAVFVGSISWIILEPTLEPHLRQFNLSPGQVGLVFLMLSGTYAIVSPFMGVAADKLTDGTPLMIAGFLFTSLNLVLLGPSPITGPLHQYSALWLNLLVIGLIGVGFSLVIVPTLDKILHFVENSGIPCDLVATGTVSGYWFAVYSMGEFVGPVLAGFLVDRIGFPWCMTCFSFLCVVMALVMCCLWMYERRVCSRGNKDEQTRLLG